MDLTLGKPGNCSPEEAAHGDSFLVIEQLAIGQARVVIYQRVQAFVSNSKPLLVIATGSALTAMLSMAAALGNPRQLLDVHMS
jgi:ferredoxin-NADP reductase